MFLSIYYINMDIYRERDTQSVFDETVSEKFFLGSSLMVLKRMGLILNFLSQYSNNFTKSKQKIGQ